MSRVLKILSECVPDGCLMIGITNDHTRNLTEVGLSRLPRCASVRSLVYDASNSCTGSTNRHCGPALRASNFRENDYDQFCWIKWRLVRDAMRSARAVFYADADVVFFQNPWPSVAESREFDIVHANNNLRHPRRMNGGLFIVHSLEFAEFALSQQPATFNNSNVLDQVLVYDAMINTGRFKHASLPQLQFRSNCWVRCSFAPTPPSAISFHAGCMGGPNKMRAIQGALADYLAPGTATRTVLHPKCNGREIVR